MTKLQRTMVDLKLFGSVNLGPVSDQTRKRYVKRVNTLLVRDNASWRCFSMKTEDGKQILYASPYNHQIMTVKDSAGNYLPDYNKLKKTAFCPEEAYYIESVKERQRNVSAQLQGFAFCMVYVKKMACGHYELFQNPAHTYNELLEWFNVVHRDKDHKCTRCICNWPTLKTNSSEGEQNHDAV